MSAVLNVVLVGLAFLLLQTKSDSAIKRTEFDCLQCHPNQLDQPFRHFAQTNDDCQKCHFLEGMDGDRPVMSVPNDKICLDCHESKIMSEKENVHWIINCLFCHQPHGAENPCLHRQSIDPLCEGSCHLRSDIEQSHPPSGATAQATGIDGLTCVAACHSMHSAQSAPMLADPVED